MSIDEIIGDLINNTIESCNCIITHFKEYFYTHFPSPPTEEINYLSHTLNNINNELNKASEDISYLIEAINYRLNGEYEKEEEALNKINRF